MLYYTEISLSPAEVPFESSICIYISGCQNHCPNCHYPSLQCADFGTPLSINFSKIVALYRKYATCVCFLGEGKNSPSEDLEFQNMILYADSLGLKSCLYSGRDIHPEKLMTSFDYLKLGSYKEALGDLNNQTTNQILLRKTSTGYENITHFFWHQ